jgi:Ca-activated chloride channel homolog
MSRRLASSLLACTLVTAFAGAALAQAPDVLITSPRGDEPVFGTVEVAADVLAAEAVAEVVLRVDGAVAARWQEPPYRATVDVGQDNVEHRFEVVARTVSGVEGRAVRVTPPIAVDEHLDLELQQLYVTVRGGNGRRVVRLPETGFDVLDNGDRQELVTFHQGDVPFTASILVDASTSMEGDRLRLAVTGAESFVRGMQDLDEASLLLFSDRLLYASSFSGETAPIERALATVEASGGTAINDHLYLALKTLEPRQGRRVVILLTDGIDIESALRMEDVRWMARRSQALIYWIRLVSGDTGSVSRFSSWRDPEQHRQELAVLEQVVDESGGRIFAIDRLEQASSVFGEILSELREQYVLGFYPTDNSNDGAWHEIRVKVKGYGDGAVRTREGYIDF